MTCLKEPLAWQANRDDGCTGAFWEARFRSVAILDQKSLLAICAYIDLNPVAAGIAATPEQSPYTPKPYVHQTFRKYLQCGIFAHGPPRARCDDCGHYYFVVLACKDRGVCPSCNTRRMVQTAAHSTDHVFPRLPVRQWVLSVPKRRTIRFDNCRRTARGTTNPTDPSVCEPLREVSTPGADADASR
jgi:Transposase zinc-binding domain